MITFLLEKNGYEVLYAGDGPKGIALARELQPMLILLDIQLPAMDGYSVARALKGDPATAHIPIVAITSYAMVDDRERGYESGCNGYMEKPIDTRTFVADIAGYMTKRNKNTVE